MATPQHEQQHGAQPATGVQPAAGAQPATGAHPAAGAVRSALWGWASRLQGVFRTEEEDAARPMAGLPRYFIAFVLLFMVGMLMISLFGDQGLIAYYRLKGESHQLNLDVAALSERRGELAREIRALRDDDGYIEMLARRRLGLVRPGEIVVQLPLPPQPGP